MLIDVELTYNLNYRFFWTKIKKRIEKVGGYPSPPIFSEFYLLIFTSGQTLQID